MAEILKTVEKIGRIVVCLILYAKFFLLPNPPGSHPRAVPETLNYGLVVQLFSPKN